jgi:hypothetical protein
VTPDQLEGPQAVYHEDRALVPSRQRVGVAIRLSGVEEEHVVGVGYERFPLSLSPEDPLAHEDDAVSRVGLLGTQGLDVGAAAEVHYGDAERVDERLPGLRLGRLRRWQQVHFKRTYGRYTRSFEP